MLLKILPLILILFSTSIKAVEFPIEIIEYINDIKVVAFINESDIDKKLSWIPFTSPPPLTIDAALKAIQKHTAAIPELTKTTLIEIELRRIPHHENYWHYLVKIKSQADATLPSHYFVVLMNGKVINAIKEPESFK